MLENSGREQPSVLVVDDEPAVTRILRSMLEVGGYSVVEVNDPAGLVDRVAADPPDLVFLDFNLPSANGLELFAGIRAAVGERVGVFLLTGESDAGLAERALAAGILDHLVKPVSLERLLSTARLGLRLQRAIRMAPAKEDRALASEAARLRALEAIVHEGVAHVGVGGKIRRLDATSGELLGVSVEEAPGRNIAEFLGPDASNMADSADNADNAEMADLLGAGEMKTLHTVARSSGAPLEVRSCRWEAADAAEGFVLLIGSH